MCLSEGSNPDTGVFNLYYVNCFVGQIDLMGQIMPNWTGTRVSLLAGACVRDLIPDRRVKLPFNFTDSLGIQGKTLEYRFKGPISYIFLVFPLDSPISPLITCVWFYVPKTVLINFLMTTGCFSYCAFKINI